MKKIILFLFFSNSIIGYAQGVGIGTNTPNSSAQLDISSNTKGLLIPRMTDVEKNTISFPAQGLMVFNTSTSSFQFYNGVSWINISHSGIITGVANKIAKFNSPWGLTPSLMTDNGAGIGINTTNAIADASATLDISSTNKGLLIPRMTTAQRNAITTPAKGLMVYDSTTNNFSFYNGTDWTDLYGGGGSNWLVLGNNIYNSNTGNVGIGASTPSAKLTVNGDAIIANGLYIGTGTPNLVNYKLDVLGNAHTSGYSIIDGFVGIGTNNPSYKLQVNDGSLAIYNSTDFKYWTMNYSSGTNTYNINEDGTARMVIENGGNVGLGLTNPAYKLDVNGTIKSSSNLIIDGGATVNNGKGVAYNGNSSANLRIYRFTTANFHAVLGAHASASTSIAFGGGFTSTPYVVVGDIESTGGTVGELDRVILVLRGCVLDTNTGVTTCTAKIINTDNASVDYNITWNCVALGY